MMKSKRYHALLQLKMEVKFTTLFIKLYCVIYLEYHQVAQTAVSARQQFEEVTAILILPYLYSSFSFELARCFKPEKKLGCVNTNQEK